MKKLILVLTVILSCVSAYAQTPELQVKAKSNVLKNGEIYEAKIYLTNVKYTSVRYEVLGMALNTDENGAGILKFKTGAGVYDSNGKSVQKREVTAIYMEEGKEKRITTEFTYTVIK